MRILGIDPGIELTGFGIIDIDGAQISLVDCGVIRTERDRPAPERLVVLEADLRALIQQYGPFDGAGVEDLFFGRNVKTAFIVGQARGVILFTLQSEGITIEEVKPVEVKMAVTGSGSAKKPEVQKMIQLQFGLEAVPQPDDAADAVAVAMTAAARFHK